MSRTDEALIEEYDENYEATGVEVERQDEEDKFEDIKRPWNPEDIRVSTKTFSLRNILDLISEESLDLAPDFQRLQVWKLRQKAQLIESILLQIPLPAFYFAEDTDGAMRVVDGLQRLSTVHDFVLGGSDNKGGFRLRELEYIDDVQGKRFADLPAPWRRRIYNTQIVVHVIDPATPAPVKYDIFRRINTGGTPLNAQEIRHCMSKPRSRAFLKRCVESPEFVSATDRALVRQKRMIDREVVLRFVAFRLLDHISDYRHLGPMEDLLWRTTERLDSAKDMDDDELEQVFQDLLQGLRMSELVFGPNAFRKWPFDAERRSPFNRALFETWTYALASLDSETVAPAAGLIVEAARNRMTNDTNYLNSITVSTGSLGRVEYRFEVVEDILSSVLS
ncbi:MAG TPA: DUF262 domain-containing protein [Acidimicrobiales bacterium]|nr:DUF262 domain-containing protein [Acidimicrobiales bacterium]